MSALLEKIWDLLDPSERSEAILLFVMMLIGMFLEAIGIGIIFPLITLLGEPARINLLLTFLPTAVKDIGLSFTQTQLLVIVLCCLILIFLIKNTFLAFLAWRQSRFAFALQADLSHRLFSLYLAQPYAFHLQNNSAQLIRNATAEVNSVTFYVVLPGLYLCTEVFVIFGLAALLFFIEPVGALLALGVLAAAGWAFQRITRDRIQRSGKSRQFHEGQRLQHLQQGLGGVKEVKLLSREDEFLRKYQHHALHYSYAGRSHVTLQQIPRLWIEILAVTGLVLLVISMLYQGRQISALLPTLALFAAAAFRLLPSISRILTYLQNLRFARPVVDVLHNEFTTLPQLKKPTNVLHSNKAFVSMLELRELTYRYPSSEGETLRGISLTIKVGECIGFIGGSGAGKSTLIDVILGLLEPTGGQIIVDGENIRDDIRSWQSQIGYVPQSIFLTDDTIRRNVAFGLPDDAISESKIWMALRAAQLENFVHSLESGLETIVGERGVRLSGGQRQRIGLARALYHDPAVLVLDEATSSLDNRTESGVIEAISALHGSKTILMVAHRLSSLRECDRIYRLERGEILNHGSYDECLL